MRALPHNLRAERSILAAVILQRGVLDDVADIVRADDFYQPAHRAVYTAMLKLCAAARPIDPITLEESLRATREIGLVGGLEGLGKLADSYGSIQQARHHATIVADRAAQRRMVQLFRTLAEEGCENIDKPRAWIASAQQRLLAASERASTNSYQPISELVHDAMKGIADEAKAAKLAQEQGLETPVTGVRTGFHKLDDMTGGLQPSELVVLAARPSMGKTALACNIASTASATGVPVLILSMEMSKDQIVRRELCSRAAVDRMHIRRGSMSADDMRNLVAAASRTNTLPIAIDDRAALSITAMQSTGRRWRRDPRFFPPLDGNEEDSRIGLIVVDYLQLGKGEDGSGHNVRNLEVGEISGGLKAMAKELKLPVLALSQLNRSVDARSDSRPKLSDLRDSGTIEQDADVVMFIYREEVYAADYAAKENCKRDAELNVAKQRNGPTETVHLTWIAEHTTFHNPARR